MHSWIKGKGWGSVWGDAEVGALDTLTPAGSLAALRCVRPIAII
jgi:hypothetical protein